MKKIMIIIILLLFSLYLYSDPDFRNVNWGMTKEEVKQIETIKFEEENDNMLIYSTRISNLDAILFYVFVGNKLTKAGYLFTEEHSNDNLFIDDFKKIDALLIKKYGAPDAQEITWKNDLYKNDPQYWGTAIAMGYLSYYTGWQNDKTYIEHDLYGDNFKITHKILYVSKELQDYEKKIKEKEATDQL